MAANIFTPQSLASQRQRIAERQAASADDFGWDDFLTKVLLPVGLGIATGVTGGLAAPASAGALGAAAAGLAAGSSGMGAGGMIGAGVDNIIKGEAAEGVPQLAKGLVGGTSGLVNNIAAMPDDVTPDATPSLSAPLEPIPQTQLRDPSASFGANPYGSAPTLSAPLAPVPQTKLQARSLIDMYNPLPLSLRR